LSQACILHPAQGSCILPPRNGKRAKARAKEIVRPDMQRAGLARGCQFSLGTRNTMGIRDSDGMTHRIPEGTCHGGVPRSMESPAEYPADLS